MPSIPFFKKHKQQKSRHYIQKNFPVRFHIDLLHYKDKNPLEECIKIYMNMRESIAGKFMSPTAKYKSTSVASHTCTSVYYSSLLLPLKEFVFVASGSLFESTSFRKALSALFLYFGSTSPISSS